MCLRRVHANKSSIHSQRELNHLVVRHFTLEVIQERITCKTHRLGNEEKKKRNGFETNRQKEEKKKRNGFETNRQKKEKKKQSGFETNRQRKRRKNEMDLKQTDKRKEEETKWI